MHNNPNIPSDQSLTLTDHEAQVIQSLRSNPLMAEKLSTLIGRYEQEIADGADAHHAEETFIADLQNLGTSMMQQWAEMAQKKALQKLDSTNRKHSKKTLQWHTTFGLIVIEQQLIRVGRRGPVILPFCQLANVTNRCASRPLQRRILDFSSERSYQKTADALKEHYQIDIPLYTIDATTTRLAQEAKHHNATSPTGVQTTQTLISEVDGSMLPVVSIMDEKTKQLQGIEAETTDKRKLRHCHWKEIRLCITREAQSAETYYGIALGEPHIIGCMMLECAKHKGLGPDTHIHAIADGATWIADQYEEQFGTNHRFHVDFFHVCEYLGAAVNSSTLDKTQRSEWLEKQKTNLRQSQMKEVLEMLENLKHQRDPIEPKKGEKEAIEIAIHYLKERKGQFDYKTAIENELPIGSGEVESAHRHILQKRLKIPGAWWRLEIAENIAQLRAMRANNRWNEFWQKKCA
jgi:hypothetical protein